MELQVQTQKRSWEMRVAFIHEKMLHKKYGENLYPQSMLLDIRIRLLKSCLERPNALFVLRLLHLRPTRGTHIYIPI